MKDFIKWLGNNEKVGKVIVWLLIIIIALIILNTTLMSLGLPHYQITYKSLVEIKTDQYIELLSRIIICFLNYCSIMFLIFPIKEHKSILKNSILYIALNIIVYIIFGYIGTQIYIWLFFMFFPYYYKNKNCKYILYSIISIVINILIQGLTYYFKANMIEITTINRVTRALLSLDYFLIMTIIILIKEIYLKKRGGVDGKHPMVGTIQQREDICKETSKKSIKSSKITNKEVVSTKK